MSGGPRYAIYFVPAPDTALYRFGSSVLGYDCYDGSDVPHPHGADGATIDWAGLTEAPRRYGFHATLKAPFHLSPESSETQLISALTSFAALRQSGLSIKPAIRLLDGFVALVPSRAVPGVDALAADCTTIFDAFRAPMSPQERARRMATRLNSAEIAHLDRWGYPYVFDRFRFHMTLTGRLPRERGRAVLALMRDLFVRTCGEAPITVDRLVLARQDDSARFRVIQSVGLH